MRQCDPRGSTRQQRTHCRQQDGLIDGLSVQVQVKYGGIHSPYWIMRSGASTASFSKHNARTHPDPPALWNRSTSMRIVVAVTWSFECEP